MKNSLSPIPRLLLLLQYTSPMKWCLTWRWQLFSLLFSLKTCGSCWNSALRNSHLSYSSSAVLSLKATLTLTESAVGNPSPRDGQCWWHVWAFSPEVKPRALQALLDWCLQSYCYNYSWYSVLLSENFLGGPNSCKKSRYGTILFQNNL